MKTKKLSVVVLVAVVFLAAVFSVPSSAAPESADAYDYYTTFVQKCDCIIDSSFELNFECGISSSGKETFAITSCTHQSELLDAMSANNTSTVWYSPGNSAFSYNTATITSFASGSKADHGILAIAYKQAVGEQKFFHIESNHQVTTQCSYRITNYDATTKAGTIPQ